MDYKNGKIYRVVCSETGRQYIGSTASTLVKRLHLHKHKKYNTCMTKDFIEPKIFLIEDFPCQRKDQLHSRERFYIESMECVNIQIPTRTKKEWTEDNKSHIIIYQKQYQKDNKETIDNQKKLWNENNKDKRKESADKYRKNNKDKRTQKINCECGGKFTLQNKSRHLKSKNHIKFSHSLQTSQPSDACPSPSVSVP